MKDFRDQLNAAREALNIAEVPRDPYKVDRVVSLAHRVRMVTNPLPVPTVCPHCQGTVGLYNNRKVYNGREFGKWPYVYLCENVACGAHVGLHPETDIPLGTLATDAIRQARQIAKSSFNDLHEDGGPMASRTAAYEWLAAKMGIEVGTCHIGWFNEQQCDRVVELCDEYFMNL
jgi:hypothetical protein